MRNRILAVLAGTAAVAALAAGVARAVMFGTPDAANQYAGVGLVVFYDSGNNPLWRCTGALISPRVLLTAGHCAGIEGASGVTPVRAQVWFSNGYPKQIPLGNYPLEGSCTGYTGYPCAGDVGGTPNAHPGWNGFFTHPNTNDIGVVVLDRPLSLPTYQLAPVGTLDSLKSKRGQQDVNFTIVGYGAQLIKPVALSARTRYIGVVQLQSLGNSKTVGYGIQLTGSPGNGTGSGATCFGDSGGPLFYKGQIVGVQSVVFNDQCRGSSASYRTDTQLARDFLAPYLP